MNGLGLQTVHKTEKLQQSKANTKLDMMCNCGDVSISYMLQQ